MRIPKYISPTALMKWEKNKEEYYLTYLAETRPPKIPQTQPMAIGSAFDAYIKSYLHERLFGKGHKDSDQFQLDRIIEAQVEPHNRDWAAVEGQYVFDCYRQSGALADLLIALQSADNEPRFEFSIEGDITSKGTKVPLLGKPDIYFVNRERRPVTFDFKVNGYCSRAATSPYRGYVNIRDGWNSEIAPQSRNVNTWHKDAHIIRIDGIKVNVAQQLEEINEEWAIQLSTYAWLCGAEIGEQFVCAIDQICGCGSDSKKDTVIELPGNIAHARKVPRLRVAEHRLTVTSTFQLGVIERYRALWETINSGWIFRDMPEEESHKKQQILDMVHIAYQDTQYADLMERGSSW